MTINAIGSNKPIEVAFGGTADATITGLLSGNGTSALVGRIITGTTNQISVTNGDGSTANPTIALASTVVRSSQPAFLAYLGTSVTNVTGDGTEYTIIFGSTAFDQNSNFNTGTGVFTAPVTGKYLFTICVAATGLTSSNTLYQIHIATTNRTYDTVGNIGTYFNASTARLSFTMQVLANMSATHTASVNINISGTGKVVGVYGNANPETWFSGYLVC